MRKKIKGNILISSFTNKKFPIFRSVRFAKERFGKNLKIYLGNKNFFPYANFFKENSLLIPYCVQKNRFKILKILINKKIRFIIPTSDQELIFWSRNKFFFQKKGINVFVSSLSSIKTCLDKNLFHKFCKLNNIPDIKVLTQKEYKKKNIKLVVKERFSFNKSETLINKNYNYVKKHLHKFKNPIFQKYIPGPEISIDAFVDDDFKVKALFLRKREFVNQGESQVSSIFRNKKLEIIFKKYFEIFQFSGFVMMQAKIIKGKIFIIECNPRIGGASTVSINNGIDTFFWQINKVINDKFTIRFNPGKKNKLYRFPIDFYL